ncbi:MAG: hypothetical protein ACC683_04325 [Acidimicrobiia bacterium]
MRRGIVIFAALAVAAAACTPGSDSGEPQATLTTTSSTTPASMSTTTSIAPTSTTIPTTPIEIPVVGRTAPDAISDLHILGYSGELHGSLSGIVAKAGLDIDGSTVHLWTDPDEVPANASYAIASTASTSWLYRDADFEGGHQRFVEDAMEQRTPPPMSAAMELAWRPLGKDLVPYLAERHHAGGTDAQPDVESVWFFEPSTGHVFWLTIRDGDEAEWTEWSFEPSHGGFGEGLVASNGAYWIELVVHPEIPAGDGGDGGTPTLQYSIDDLRTMLDRVLALWEKTGGFPNRLLSSAGRHSSFLRSVVRTADARMYGPFVTIDWTGEKAPKLNEVPIVSGDGTYPWVTFYSAVEGSELLTDSDVRIDLDGPNALFVTQDAAWFFCLDTAFSVDTGIDYVRELAAEVCPSSR